MPKHETYYSLVLSDLHFGDSRCSLHSMKAVRAFTEQLKPFAPLRQIFLLGDILDLQLANWAQAIEGLILPNRGRVVGFRYFFNYLLEQTGASEVFYIPGNHDYRIFDYHSIDRFLIHPLRSGKKLSGRVAFFRTFPESFLQGLVKHPDVKIKVCYPHHSAKINRARVIFTHGHFFDPTQAFNHEVGKIFSRAENLEQKQIRRIRHDYMRRVSLYQNVVSTFMMRKELRDWFSLIYQPLTSWSQHFVHRKRKRFLTKAMIRSIDHYVAFCSRSKKVDGVIFGHTHQAGKADVSQQHVRYVWNSGTFLREAPSSPDGSFLILRNDGRTALEDAVQVHYLRL
jgi:UDP-2,3-diacylglucosamine pyrophosphatase LpxH